MSQFAIIKDAPLFPIRGKYPFAAMDVGDAFDAPRDMGLIKSKSDRRQSKISSAAWQWAKINNPTAKFSVRLLDDKTVRCWRVA